MVPENCVRLEYYMKWTIPKFSFLSIDRYMYLSSLKAVPLLTIISDTKSVVLMFLAKTVKPISLPVGYA